MSSPARTFLQETQPLLQTVGSSPHLIQSDHAGILDSEHPVAEVEDDSPSQWSAVYRWEIVSLLFCTSFATTFANLSIVSIASGIIEQLDGRKNKFASVLLVTTWELGEATGPFLHAPLSELFGRRPVMNISIASLIICTTLASSASSGAMIIVMRFLSGMSVSTNVLNPAILGDMLPADQLGTAMSLMILAPLLGGAVGPVLGGVLATRFGWRTMLRVCVVGLLICEVLFFTMFRETCEMVIQKRKLEKSVGEQAAVELRQTQTARHLLTECLVRPFAILWSSSMLQALSVYGSVDFAFLYIVSTTLPGIMQDCFHQTEAEGAFAFLPLSLGTVIAVIICNRLLDRIYIALRHRYGDEGEPEYRLPLAVCAGFALPLSIVSFGWAAHATILIMRLALVFLGCAMLVSSLPAMSYVVGAFHRCSASALTAMIVARALVGALMPLTIGPMVKAMGYGITFTAWGAISLCLAPVPLLCMRYGRRWRQRSTYSKDQ